MSFAAVRAEHIRACPYRIRVRLRMWSGRLVVDHYALRPVGCVRVDPRSALLSNYDVTAGKMWILVPTAMFVGPELMRRLAAREHADVRHVRPA